MNDLKFKRLFSLVDISTIVYFRIIFGLIMLVEVYRYFDKGWITKYFVTPEFHFTYYGFSWVKPWAGYGMNIHFIALGVLALFIMCGLFYRLATILFFLGFSYVFLLEQARYLNHFYLIILISFALIFVPAHKRFSFDSLWRPKIRTDTAPAWALWLLRLHVAIPYLFGGIAKINSDWLSCEPMRMWLAKRTDFPLFGQYFTEEWAVYAMSYGGLLFDLLVIPLLLWKKTRPYALAAAVIFNVMNDRLFNIGIFPWFMLAATLMFCSSDWPRNLVRKFRGGETSEIADHSQAMEASSTRRRVTVTLLAIYVLFHSFMPFRPLLYSSNPHWTEEGHRFSWRMKLRSKRGRVKFRVVNLDTKEERDVHLDSHLSRFQIKKLPLKPDMILQFAHYLRDHEASLGRKNIAVYASSKISLNGRKKQEMIRQVDLSCVERSLAAADWILPLNTPLKGSEHMR